MPHHFRLSDDAIRRVTARQGKPHLIDEMTAATTALVVIDMQVYFIGDGMPAAAPVAKEIVPAINQLADHLRQTGGKVIWIVTDGSPAASDGWSGYRALHSDTAWARRQTFLAPEGEGYPLWPDLRTSADDLTVVKSRYSAFAPESSALDATLRQCGVDTLLIAGTATGVCCQSTAVDAMQHNYRVAMLSDALAAQSDEEHAGALNQFYLRFGDVLTTQQVIDRLR